MIENDIYNLLFVEHEEDMKNFTHLQPIVKELAELMERHAEAAVRQYQMEIIPTIAQHLQDEVGTLVMGHKYQPKPVVPYKQEGADDAVPEW